MSGQPPPPSNAERRDPHSHDRRRVARGGRRLGDAAGRYPTLLVADSYEHARRPCVRYLEHFGFRVEEASNGDEALAAIHSSRPQLILAELSLPKVSARELARRLATWTDTRNIPIIVLAATLHSSGTTVFERAAGLLVKPFSLTTMLDEIRRVLRLHMGAS
jgi:DNA-binding response OmpR family regulator